MSDRPTASYVIPESVYLAAGRAYWDETVHERELRILAAQSAEFRAAVAFAFAAGYDHHRQTCDITNPRGWTPEQIREMERRSAELDKLIDRDEEDSDG